MLRSVPLLIIPLLVYNGIMLSGEIHATLAVELFSLDLISGALWVFTVRDLFIGGGVLLLYVEIFKATRTGMASVVDHTLSTVVFVVYLIEFLTVARCGTSTFALLGLMSMIDVIAGFTVSIVAARRDFAVGPGQH